MSNSKPFVFIPIEIESRDFDSRLLVALSLLQYGIGSVIIDDKMLSRLIPKLPPSVLFDKSFTEIIFKSRMQPAFQNGWAISGIDEESYLTKSDTRTYKRFSQKCAEIVDLPFFWSKDHMLNVSNFMSNSVWEERGFVSGSQRLDLLSNYGRLYYQDTFADLRNLYGDYTLFNTNFVANSCRSIRDRINICVKNGEIQSKDELKSFTYEFEYDKLVLDQFCDDVYDFAVSSTNQIVIRPHPGELMDFYINRFQDLENVVVQRIGPVEPWLHSAKSVVAHHCTTLLQASLASVPCYNYQYCAQQDRNPPPYFVGRPTEYLPSFSTSNLNSSYNKSDTFVTALSNLWHLPSESSTNSMMIASGISKMLDYKSVKEVSPSHLHALLSRIKVNNYVNPKIHPSLFETSFRKVFSMIKSYSMPSYPSFLASIPKVGLIIA